MKFVKENLTVLICALVAVLLVVAVFVYPIPSWVADLKKEMTQDIAVKSVIKQAMSTPLALPGVKEEKGIPSAEFIAAKKSANEQIEAQKAAVEEAGRKANAQGRITAAGVPLLPAPTAANPNGTIEEPNLLPKLRGDALKYKADYMSQHRMWTGWLLKGTPTDSDLDASMPPIADALKTEWDEKQKARQATLPPGTFVTVGQDTGAFYDFQKQRIANKASELMMYVDRYAFQVRSFAGTDNPPTEQEIFESLVDSWLQSDLVKSIAAINAAGSAGGGEKNISRSPVKRLTRVIIGNAARTRLLTPGPTLNQSVASGPILDVGPLFLTPYNAFATLGGGFAQPIPVAGGAAADVPAPENMIDYNMGMSGRSAGKDYDTVLMDVVLDIDPAKLNGLIDQLYRQNMGYTVSSVQIKTVDPLDRASNGYLYGEGQVVEAEITVECLFFRSWTLPLLPDAERANLGLPPIKAP